MSTLTIYGTSRAAKSDVYSTHATYLTARASSTLGGPYSGAESTYFGQETGYYCTEGFEEFDTSALADDATVTGAWLHTWVLTIPTTATVGRCRLRDWGGGALDTTDYVAGASLAALTLLAHTALSSSILTGQYYLWHDNAFAANINRAGSTRVIYHTQALEDATVPAATDVFRTYNSSNAGTVSDPYLVVTYSDGYPTVVEVADSWNVSNTTDAVLNVPINGIAAGNLLIGLIAVDGNTAIAWPAGWEEIADVDATGSRFGCAYRIADGGEADHIHVTTGNEQMVGKIYRITNWHGTEVPAIATAAATSATCSPPDLNPANWDTPEKTLWIVGCGHDYGTRTISAWPYTTGQNYIKNGTTTGAGMAVCITETTDATLAPGNFTISASEENVGFTIGVRPVVAAAPWAPWDPFGMSGFFGN